MFTTNQSTGPAEATQPEKTRPETTRAEKTGVGTADHYPHQAIFQPPAWLTAAVTPECVRTGLLRQVPEFATGQLVLDGCEVKRLRFRESQGSWSGIYLLTIAGLPLALQDGGQTQQQVVP